MAACETVYYSIQYPALLAQANFVFLGVPQGNTPWSCHGVVYCQNFPLTSTRVVVYTSLIVEKTCENSRAFRAGNAGVVGALAAGRFVGAGSDGGAARRQGARLHNRPLGHAGDGEEGAGLACRRGQRPHLPGAGLAPESDGAVAAPAGAAGFRRQRRLRLAASAGGKTGQPPGTG